VCTHDAADLKGGGMVDWVVVLVLQNPKVQNFKIKYLNGIQALNGNFSITVHSFFRLFSHGLPEKFS
jgi:hypothetical protein